MTNAPRERGGNLSFGGADVEAIFGDRTSSVLTPYLVSRFVGCRRRGDASVATDVRDSKGASGRWVGRRG